MAKKFTICCKNTGTEEEISAGLNLKDLQNIFQPKLEYPILGAWVNNQVEELDYELYKPKIIHFFDYTSTDGMRMYLRSLYFLFMKAVKDLFPDTDIGIEHAVANGYFCEFKNNGTRADKRTIGALKKRMNELIQQDLPYSRKVVLNTEAIRIFEDNNMTEKARLFKQSPSLYTSVYSLHDMTDYFYGYLVPSTGCLHKYDLIPFYNGMLLRVPDRQNPDQLRPLIKQDKMFEVLEEHKYRVEVLNATNIGRINEQVLNGESGELIKIAEALHERKISQIVDRIYSKKDTRLVLVSGPSSSGKTTFSKRLSVQLKVSGIDPVMVSLDNYFVNRDKTPLDEAGEYDFEALEALDLKLLNKNINDLLAGKEIEVPSFDFATGSRFYSGKTLKIKRNSIIIAEGIHALNPKLTAHIDDAVKYKVYVSALTQICIDAHNRIPTTDNRMLRRMIRDHKYRGYSALETLQRWPSVRRGEKRNIFPYQEQADMMFNSALLYELGVLKKHAEPLLREIWENQKEYAEAQRLLKFISYFKDIPEREIPPTSILREFLGESSFKY
jgi:uridine kinase